MAGERPLQRSAWRWPSRRWRSSSRFRDRQLHLGCPGADQGRGSARREGAAAARSSASAPAHLREIAALKAQRRELPLRAQAAQGEIERDCGAGAAGRRERRPAARSSCARRRTASSRACSPSPGRASRRRRAGEPGAGRRALQAQLFAPSSAIGFVRPDQAVLLRYQAFPYQKFGHQRGARRCRSRARRSQAAELAGLPLPAAPAQAASRCTASPSALDAQASPAYGRPGRWRPACSSMPTSLLDRRRLIEWMFEPLLGSPAGCERRLAGSTACASARRAPRCR